MSPGGSRLGAFRGAALRRRGFGSLLTVEAQRRRVHAVPQPRRPGAVREHVAEVGAAIATHRFGPGHPVTLVDVLLHRVGGEGLEEARPAGAGLELRVGREQRRIAAHAYVGAVVVTVPVLARERALGAGLAGDLELGRVQTLTPLRVGLGELV